VSDIDGIAHINGTLVIPGSGAYHRDYHEWLPDLVIRAAAMFEHVEILASSFDLSIPVVRRAVTQRNVNCYARDPRSYRELASAGRGVLAPDVAVFCHALDDTSNVTGESTLVALRTDASSPLATTPWRPAVDNNDLSATTATVDEFIAPICSHATIVTDRLHIALAGALLGRTVRYVDHPDQKISGTLRVALRNDFDSMVEPVSVPWLADRGYVRT
jgi:hypothetical protein